MPYTYSAGTTTPNLAGLAEYNGVRINDGTFELHHLGGLIDSPPLRLPLSSLPSDSGGFLGPRFYDPLQINLEGKLIVADYTQIGPALDQLRGAFNLTAGLQTLTVNYPGWAGARQVTAGVSGPITVDEPADLDKLTPERTFVIPMTAPDPLLYDAVNLKTATVPMDGSSVAVTNSGNAPTYFTAKINGPWSSPSAVLTQTETGNVITYGGSGAGGGFVTYNTNPVVGLTVTNTGGGNAYQFAGTWTLFTIPPGTSHFTLTASGGGTTIASNAVITWRDAWV